jgi:hypothetical protein
LKTLYLGENTFGKDADAMQLFTTALCNNTNLEFLDLGSNDIGDAGAKAFVRNALVVW